MRTENMKTKSRENSWDLFIGHGGFEEKDMCEATRILHHRKNIRRALLAVQVPEELGFES